MKLVSLIEQINEAPIGDFELAGDWNQKGSFAEPDKKMMQRPHLEPLTRTKFQNTPHTYDFYFVNLPEYTYSPSDDEEGKSFSKDFDKWAANAGVVSSNEVKQMIGAEIENNPNSIIVIFLSNVNEKSKVGLTPWMMAHRFAHGLDDDTGAAGQVMRSLYIQLNNLVRMFRNTPARYFLTMKSARNQNLPDSEAGIELIAQHIMTGSVKLSRIASIELREKFSTLILDNGIKISIPTPTNDNYAEYLNAKIQEFEDDINDTITQLLDSLVGQIIVTV